MTIGPASAVLRSREELEHLELERLGPYAEKAALSRGREHPLPEHPYRTAFQRDRDRIMYTTAFRRLQYKTQVFVNYEGDYYRTRLTHTSEAAQIARTVARALGCNEDLAEAITLAHDLGHPAFGHSGEVTLDRLMLERMGLDPADPANAGRGFNHTYQSLRIVESLEKRWPEFRGLNLTWETREGIVKHSTEYDSVARELAARFEPDSQPSLEAQIVDLADELTYSAHDLDDGLRSGLLDAASPALESLDIWRLARRAGAATWTELERHRRIRALIDLLISDLVTTTSARLEGARVGSPEEARAWPERLVTLSPDMQSWTGRLKRFLLEELYQHPRVVRMHRKAARVMKALFEAFESDYRQLPLEVRQAVAEAQPDVQPGGQLTLRAYRIITDHLAGMTDRYALQEYRRLYDPAERA
jgi:dGTPase